MYVCRMMKEKKKYFSSIHQFHFPNSTKERKFHQVPIFPHFLCSILPNAKIKHIEKEQPDMNFLLTLQFGQE